MASTSQTSYLNTPQAVDDTFTLKDIAGTTGGLTTASAGASQSGSLLTLNVFLNDGGGNAKSLVDIVDGRESDVITNSTAVTDLMNGYEGAITSSLGAKVAIANAKTGAISYDFAAIQSRIDALTEGATLVDTITYSIRLANGTFSFATMTVTFVGTNDIPTVTAATAQVTEDLTVEGRVQGTDTDTGQTATLTYALTGASPTGLTFNANGTYSFDASSYDRIPAGQTETVTVNFTAKDASGGISAPQTLTITITGTNDRPTIDVAASTVTGTLGEDDASTGGHIEAGDLDTGATLTYAAALTEGDADYGSFDIDADGNWTFTLDSAAAQHLGEGETAELTYTVTVTDDKGASVQQTVTVTITGSNDVPVLNAPAAATVDENGSTSGRLSATDAEGDTITYAVEGESKPPAGFSLNPDGSWSFDPTGFDHLADGASETFNVAVVANDGSGNSESRILSLTVTGSNDAATFSGDTSASIGEDATAAVSGTLTTSDLDKDQSGFGDNAATVATEYGTFTFDNATGGWTFATNTAAQELTSGRNIDQTMTVKSIDGTTQTITATVNGADDAATFGGSNSASIGEDATAAVSGTLTTSDLDKDQSGFASTNPTSVTSQYGTFTFDNATGGWTFATNAAAQELTSGQNIDQTMTVKSIDGTTQTITATVNGADDAARITNSNTTAAVTEDGTRTASGTLGIVDPDAGQQGFNSAFTQTGTFGSFTFNAGSWTYTLDNGATNVQALNSGDTRTDSMTVTSLDGTTHVVSVNIAGANEPVATVSPLAVVTGGGDPTDNSGASQQGGVANNSDNTLTGTAQDNTLNGLGGNDTIYARAGGDSVSGGSGTDLIYGQAGGDTLSGGDGADRILGGSGADSISGDAGDDTVTAGFGGDTVSGGADADRFVFVSASDRGDLINDFQVAGADSIDVSNIDANTGTGANEFFNWGGTTATANGLWYADGASAWTVYADTDGDATTAEFWFTVTRNTGVTLDEGDFTL